MFDIPYMQLHGYLEALIGSRTSINLMRALINHPGRVFTVRKLAEAAKVSASEAAIYVQQLEKFGVLNIQPVGRAYLLSLNDQSYILNHIFKPMIKAETQTLDELISILRDNLGDTKAKASVISAVLFGSVVTKVDREDSDVDLLVISEDFDEATTLVSKAQEKISLAFNSRLSPLIMNQKEVIKKKNDSLIQSILANCIIVTGKDLREILESND